MLPPSKPALFTGVGTAVVNCLRLGLSVVVMAGLGMPLAVAQQPPPIQAPPPDHPQIEPDALAKLKATSQRLAAARSMSFTAVATYESPARNGQPLYYSTLSYVEMQRPNKLRVITPGDGPPSDFYYNGTTIVAYAPAADLAAVANAPPSIGAALAMAYDKAAIFFPFADMIDADPYAKLADGLTSAYVVGQSHFIGDGKTITDMIALANKDVQAEIWIGIDDGLPRMIRAIYPSDPVKARYEVQFSDWRLDQPTKDSDFVSVEALKAPRMSFERPDTPFPPKAQ
jgi:hypothetical protein